MIIGEKVRKTRKDKKLTLKRLSGLVGVTVSFLSDIENGKKQPSLETLGKISAALGVPINAFFSEDICVPLQTNTQDFSHNSFMEQAKALFMSDELSQEDKEAIFKDLTDLYWRCKGYTK